MQGIEGVYIRNRRSTYNKKKEHIQGIKGVYTVSRRGTYKE